MNDANGQPKDLTGYTAQSQLRKSYYSTTAIDLDVTIANALNGEIDIGLSAANTANIAPGRYAYDVIITETNSGVVTRIFEGTATVLPSVTR